MRAARCHLTLLVQTLLVGSVPVVAQGAHVHFPAGAGAIVEVLSSVPPQTTEADPTMERAALSFLDGYFGLWSAGNLAAMAFVEGEYADLVDFYGKPTQRQVIVEAKRKYIERWPERSYLVRPGSLRIACDGGSATCLITGVVDWDCRSIDRGAHSAGVSDFTLRVAFAPSGVGKVVLEAGSVTARSALP
jgi:hypothetical protein